MIKQKPKYFKSLDQKILIKQIPNGKYYVTNTLEHYEIDINNFETKQIKLQEYAKLMNLFFKDIEDEWEFRTFPKHTIQKFKKLPNFKNTSEVYQRNLIWYEIDNKKVIIVYNWGKLYYMVPMYGGTIRGYLLDFKTHKFVKWTQAKNCAPVLNVSLNKLIYIF